MKNLLGIGLVMALALLFLPTDNTETMYVSGAKFVMQDDDKYHWVDESSGSEVIIDLFKGTHTLIFLMNNRGVMNTSLYESEMKHDKHIMKLVNKGVSSFQVYVLDDDGNTVKHHKFRI